MTEGAQLYVCVGSGRLKVLLTAFTDKTQAEAWVDSANEWYGRDHPLTPIKVEPVRMNMRPFPVAAMRALDAAETEEDSDEAIRAMFATLVDDPEPAEPTGPGFIGGRKR